MNNVKLINAMVNEMNVVNADDETVKRVAPTVIKNAQIIDLEAVIAVSNVLVIANSRIECKQLYSEKGIIIINSDIKCKDITAPYIWADTYRISVDIMNAYNSCIMATHFDRDQNGVANPDVWVYDKAPYHTSHEVARRVDDLSEVTKSDTLDALGLERTVVGYGITDIAVINKIDLSICNLIKNQQLVQTKLELAEKVGIDWSKLSKLPNWALKDILVNTFEVREDTAATIKREMIAQLRVLAELTDDNYEILKNLIDRMDIPNYKPTVSDEEFDKAVSDIMENSPLTNTLEDVIAVVSETLNELSNDINDIESISAEIEEEIEAERAEPLTDAEWKQIEKLNNTQLRSILVAFCMDEKFIADVKRDMVAQIKAAVGLNDRHAYTARMMMDEFQLSSEKENITADQETKDLLNS